MMQTFPLKLNIFTHANYKYMKKKDIWKIIGVIILVALMLYWLFAGTLLEEDDNAAMPSDLIEQSGN